jgi:two-component system, chemotaxis family, sensor kinase Cph1
MRIGCGNFVLVTEPMMSVSPLKVSKTKISMQESFPEVLANVYQLESLLKNLIDDAISFARPDLTGEIQITCKDNGSDWLFCVEDNGIGIDAMQSEDVFQPFVRLGARPDGDGTGMGLALSRKIVLSQKRWIWVESERYKGAKFFFTLPK